MIFNVLHILEQIEESVLSYFETDQHLKILNLKNRTVKHLKTFNQNNREMLNWHTDRESYYN